MQPGSADRAFGTEVGATFEAGRLDGCATEKDSTRSKRSRIVVALVAIHDNNIEAAAR